MTSNIINLADHRPPAPQRPSRLSRLARWSDSAMCTLVVAVGLCGVAWFPGAAIGWLLERIWIAAPWFVLAAAKAVPAVAIGAWAGLSMRRLQNYGAPASCSVNVHVFDDDTAITCRCGATGDVNTDGGAA